MVRIRRVLEMGCGNYSTLVFLDRRAFPDLVNLESLETDAAWAALIKTKIPREPRLDLRLVEAPLETTLQRLQLDNYDLLLVDHADKYEIRSATVAFLARHFPPHALVVLHDYEIPLYRHAAREFRHKFEFRAFTPSTCVAWDLAPVRGAALRLLDRTVKQQARTLRPEDSSAWVDLLHGTFGPAPQAAG